MRHLSVGSTVGKARSQKGANWMGGSELIDPLKHQEATACVAKG